ncbi:MAG TPA: magnesium and cobalt transport protein CorA [Cellulomonas sp.]
MAAPTRRPSSSPFGWRTRGSASTPTEPVRSGLVRLSVLDDGLPVPDVAASSARELAASLGPGSPLLAVLAYDRPSEAEVREVGEVLDLHPVLLEDLLHAGQRPKLERYGDALFTVLRPAEYLDEVEDIAFVELHVIIRDGWVVVMRQGSPGDAPWDVTRFGQDADLFRLGPEAVLYAMIDTVVDGYFRVLDGVNVDVDEIERQVFSGDAAAPERIYRLSREVIDLQHATAPLVAVVGRLRAGFRTYQTAEGLQAHLQDVADHLDRVTTRVAEIRDVLGQILTVNATLVGQRQNEDMKTISAWAAILLTPTLVGAVYGMNFDHMPELHWAFGYPAAIAAMVVMAAGLYVAFKIKRWL